jgi:hypothetical protein
MFNNMIYISFGSERELTQEEMDSIISACIAQVEEPTTAEGEPMGVLISGVEARTHETITAAELYGF